MTEREASDGELIRGSATATEMPSEISVRALRTAGLRARAARLRDRGQAEDVAQETFASVWRAAGSYRPERGPGARLAVRGRPKRVVDRDPRERARQPSRPSETGSEAGPEDAAQTDWLAWRVHRAFTELPETERNVLELAYWGGLSQSEIADFLGIPLGTVKTRTRSGLARMADLLEGEELRG